MPFRIEQGDGHGGVSALPRDRRAHQAALGLAIYAGLRIGEVEALDWSNIDLDGQTPRVVRAWDEKCQGTARILSTKSAGPVADPIKIASFEA